MASLPSVTSSWLQILTSQGEGLGEQLLLINSGPRATSTSNFISHVSVGSAVILTTKVTSLLIRMLPLTNIGTYLLPCLAECSEGERAHLAGKK